MFPIVRSWPVLLRELEIALIMRRDGHDRAPGSVLGQDEVGDQIGTSWRVNGLTALRPVSNPSLPTALVQSCLSVQGAELARAQAEPVRVVLRDHRIQPLTGG